MLREFLDYLRESVAAKVETTPDPEVRTAQVSSGTNLLGLLNHLTYVEEAVFLGGGDRLRRALESTTDRKTDIFDATVLQDSVARVSSCSVVDPAAGANCWW